MRYWMDGEDEGFERELERVRRFGGQLPASVSVPESLLVLALSMGEVLLFVGLVTLLFIR